MRSLWCSLELNELGKGDIRFEPRSKHLTNFPSFSYFCSVYPRKFKKQDLLQATTTSLRVVSSSPCMSHPIIRHTASIFQPRWPGFYPRSGMWYLLYQWSRFSASTSIYPTISHSTNFSIFINHPIIGTNIVVK
jgi:hypothetical protein